MVKANLAELKTRIAACTVCVWRTCRSMTRVGSGSEASGSSYPGTGKSGDLPPRPECPPTWHEEVFAQLPKERLTLLLGTYAQKLMLGADYRGSVSATAEAWREFVPRYLPMPHPSPRNQRWFKEHPWFEAEVVPRLQRAVAAGRWMDDD